MAPFSPRLSPPEGGPQPDVGIADDSVDPELIERPRRWDVRFLARFFHAPPDLFRTGWFVESLLTELLVALVILFGFVEMPGTVLILVVMISIMYVAATGVGKRPFFRAAEHSRLRRG